MGAPTGILFSLIDEGARSKADGGHDLVESGGEAVVEAVE
jgi:hypothetical protein